MANLFIVDFYTTITTVMLVGIIVFVVYSFLKREGVDHWGRRTLLTLGWGLFIYITAAIRDSNHLSVQHVVEENTFPGLFTLTSFPSIAGMVLAAIIILAGFVTLFVNKQSVRKVMFLHYLRLY